MTVMAAGRELHRPRTCHPDKRRLGGDILLRPANPEAVRLPISTMRPPRGSVGARVVEQHRRCYVYAPHVGTGGKVQAAKLTETQNTCRMDKIVHFKGAQRAAYGICIG